MQRLGHFERFFQTERAGTGRRRRGWRAPAVRCPDRVPRGLQAEPATAAPVTGAHAKREEAGGAPVRRHADAVDPRAAGNADTPVPLRPRGRHVVQACAEHREGVVGHHGRTRPALVTEHPLELAFFGRKVPVRDAADQVRSDQASAGAVTRRRLGAGLICLLPRQLHGRPDQLVDYLNGLVAEPNRHAGTADQREQRPVPRDEGDIGLAVPAIDRKTSRKTLPHGPLAVVPGAGSPTAPASFAHGRNAAFSASSRSVSCSALSYCPISGGASMVSNTRSRPPSLAVCTATSAYAATWAVKPPHS